MFQLKRYVLEKTHIVDYMELEIEQNFSCLEKLVGIFDHRERERLKNKVIPLVFISWNYHSIQDLTWEQEDKIQV